MPSLATGLDVAPSENPQQYTTVGNQWEKHEAGRGQLSGGVDELARPRVRSYVNKMSCMMVRILLWLVCQRHV